MHTLIRRGEVRIVHRGSSVRVPTREPDAVIARISATISPSKSTSRSHIDALQQDAGNIV